MLAIQAALCGSTGKDATSVFQTLSEGNTEQLGAPGSGEPADAAVGATTVASPAPANPASKQVASNALVCVRAFITRGPTVAQWVPAHDDNVAAVRDDVRTLPRILSQGT
jgi:hypothetical protein